MNKLFILLSSLFIAISFISCAQTKEPLPKDKFITLSMQDWYIKDNVITDTLDIEHITKEDAFIYDFTKANKVYITNIANEFSWEFDLIQKGNVLTLVNVNADAEDDELAFSWRGSNLILTRNTEDADPEDEDSSIIVRREHILEKVK